MKRRMGPIADAPDQTVFDWIDIAIFDVAGVVRLIANQVFPKSTLPDATLMARNTDRAQPFLFWQAARKAALDQSPTGREIGIAHWQRPHRMKVVRKHDESIDRERQAVARVGHCGPQALDLINEKTALPLQQVHGEEPAATRYKCATIVWHTDEGNAGPACAEGMADYASLIRPTRFYDAFTFNPSTNTSNSRTTLCCQPDWSWM